MLDIKANKNNSLEIFTEKPAVNNNNVDLDIKNALRKKRSDKYLELLSSLDSGQHKISSSDINEIVSGIKNELGIVEMHIPNILRGVIAKCYLGPEYEVHSLDMAKNICNHYKIGEELEGVLEKARSLAMNDFYDYVEVYDGYCCAISASGEVSLVEF